MKKGFTLLELMIVLFIVATIGSALFMAMSSGHKSWASADTQISLQQELRKAMAQIATELRDSGPSQISCPSDGSNCASIAFNISQGVTGTGLINWSTTLINYSLSAGQIVRIQGASSRVIANNITAIGFVRQATSSKIVRITLATQRLTTFGNTLNATLDSAVLMRN